MPEKVSLLETAADLIKAVNKVQEVTLKNNIKGADADLVGKSTLSIDADFNVSLDGKNFTGQDTDFLKKILADSIMEKISPIIDKINPLLIKNNTLPIPQFADLSNNP